MPKPGFGDPRGNFVAGEVIAHVRLFDRTLADPDDPAQRRRFTLQDAMAVADTLNAALDQNQEPDLRHLRFEPYSSTHQWSPDQDGRVDYSTVFLRRPIHGANQPRDAHAFVRFRLKDRADGAYYSDHTQYPRNYDVVQSVVKALNQPQPRRVLGVDGQRLGDEELLMPNWIMTGDSNHGSSGSGGGPGAPPVVIKPTELQGLADLSDKAGSPGAEWPFHVRFMRDANDSIEQEVDATVRGKDVIVLVLDTAPKLQEIDDAINGPLSNNNLLKSMRSRLTTVREDLGDIPVTEVEPTGGGPAYKMRDHGLFVAGLIHDIAPAAEIQLWRVLNEWGGGDLGTLLHAMSLALELARLKDQPVIINLSVVITMPVEKLDDEWAKQGFNFGQRLTTILQLMMGEHLKTKCVAVAAAGNGSGDPNPARLPRYPARLNTVIAVAAADRHGNPAKFSDRGEDPGTQRNGVATFGGDTDYSTGVPEIPTEIDIATGRTFRDAPIGLMISPRVPQETGEANTTGWAFWAGTSFSTPIISGLVACLLSDTNGGPTGPGTATIINTIVGRALEPGPHNDLNPNLGVLGIPARQLIVTVASPVT